MAEIVRSRKLLWALAAVAMLWPGVGSAQDRDTKGVQDYVLTEAGLAKYKRATESLAALPGGMAGACADDDDDAASIAAAVLKVDAVPGAKAAIQSAGMTTREYVVFSYSMLTTGLAAWAVHQPGGKLPPGVLQANVDFYDKHAAELKDLAERAQDACDDEEELTEDEPEEEE